MKNVLFLVPEQIRNDYLGYNGNPFPVSPNIDALAKRGVSFSHCYSPMAKCTPSRIAVASGRYPHSGGLFGIPKSCRNFDLSLEFLQFITSWRVSQKVMIGYCKWPTPVKDSEYTGLMKHFEPNPGNGSLQIQLPFETSNNCKSRTNILSGLEMIILNNINDDKGYFWNNFLGQNYNMRDELSEVMISCIRKYYSMEELRMSLQLQYMAGPPDDRGKIERREKMTLESVVYNMRQSDIEQISIDALQKIQKEYGDGD